MFNITWNLIIIQTFFTFSNVSSTFCHVVGHTSAMSFKAECTIEKTGYREYRAKGVPMCHSLSPPQTQKGELACQIEFITLFCCTCECPSRYCIMGGGRWSFCPQKESLLVLLGHSAVDQNCPDEFDKNGKWLVRTTLGVSDCVCVWRCFCLSDLETCCLMRGWVIVGEHWHFHPPGLLPAHRASLFSSGPLSGLLEMWGSNPPDKTTHFFTLPFWTLFLMELGVLCHVPDP